MSSNARNGRGMFSLRRLFAPFAATLRSPTKSAGRRPLRPALEVLEDRLVPTVGLRQAVTDYAGHAGPSAASVTANFLTSTNSGDFVVAAVTYEAVDTLTLPSGWTSLTPQTTGATAMVIAYDYDCGSFSSMTFSTSAGGAQNFVNVVVGEYVGVMATGNPLDVSADDSGGGPSLSTGTTSSIDRGRGDEGRYRPQPVRRDAPAEGQGRVARRQALVGEQQGPVGDGRGRGRRTDHRVRKGGADQAAAAGGQSPR